MKHTIALLFILLLAALYIADVSKTEPFQPTRER